jgi:hypothetical protein
MGARFERALAALADFCRRHKVVVGIVVGLALFAAIVWVPKLGFVQPDGLTKAADRAKAESDFRGHLIQAIGGLVLAAGAYFTGRTFALNREGQHTERFTRAIDQLADEKLDIRLGGIHALDRIAHDSKTYYLPVMEVLTAFLRENARWRDSLSQAEKEPSSLGDVPALRSDLQAAATVVARRDLSTSEAQAFRVNLFGADLTGAYLPDAKLTEANLRYVNPLTPSFVTPISSRPSSAVAASRARTFFAPIFEGQSSRPAPTSPMPYSCMPTCAIRASRVGSKASISRLLTSPARHSTEAR